VVSSQDADYLRLLCLFHYIVAAIFAIFASIQVIHLVIGIAMADSKQQGVARRLLLRSSD
jgi:hypothetical protein